MVLIYSNEAVEGLSGTYVAPFFFDEKALEKAAKVYARDLKILDAYKKQGVETHLIGEDGNQEINIDELMENLENLKAPQLKKLCEHFEIEYVNKDEAILALSEIEL